MAKEKLYNSKSAHYIKYMGSKTKILPFVIDGIQSVYRGGIICDLFAGSASLSGALSEQAPILSNDIQVYSSVLAKSYLTDWNNNDIKITEIRQIASDYHRDHYRKLVAKYRYHREITLEQFNTIEERSRLLINENFENDWHLFTKYYSGTWWSVEQCTWIDSYRKAIEDYRGNPMYNTLLCCLMYAAAYNSQGTGHYAQYRDANTQSSFEDILSYRSKKIKPYFDRKFREAFKKARKAPNPLNHEVKSLDYIDCLKGVQNATVYADPPYCFVHYSRFYHALETMVLYDYPELQEKNGEIVKGRYRVARHQSPFCIKTQVEDAFTEMFSIIKENNCSLVLSYSDTGMITIKKLRELALRYFEKKDITVKSLNHSHMTMGRKKDRKRDVKEKLLVVKRPTH